MVDYRVKLDIFAGPMDLLLYLVRKEEVDIYDIPISRITDQYLHYIDMLKSLDMDLAGDFLVMAATLMQIKSAMLLPRTEAEDTESEALEDPRAELIRQLLEYKRFKDASNLLRDSAEQHSCRYCRPAVIIENLEPESEPELDMEQVNIWDLLEAFDNILSATGTAAFDVSRITDDTPIDLYQIEILHRLQSDGAVKFERIFESAKNRLVMVGRFLALLELAKANLIFVEHLEKTNSLYLRALTDQSPEEAVQKAFRPAELNEEDFDHPPVEIVEIGSGRKKQQTEPVHSGGPVPISELPVGGKAEDSHVLSDTNSSSAPE